jgi:hypothetical protein
MSNLPVPPTIPGDANVTSLITTRPKVAAKGTATIATPAIDTGVVNAASGTITVTTATTAAQGFETATITNSYCSESSVVIVSVKNYSGTGNPVVTATTVSEGSFVITTSNPTTAAGDALSGTMDISFLIV